MFRERPGPDATADADAVAELVVRGRRLSQRVLAIVLVVGLLSGAALAALAFVGYGGSHDGRAIGARLGWAFCAGAVGVGAVGMFVRRKLVRWALARWVDELASRGVERDGLEEAASAFLPR